MDQRAKWLASKHETEALYRAKHLNALVRIDMGRYILYPFETLMRQGPVMLYLKTKEHHVIC